ncbi:alpha/beta fold hydrolase [Chelatococcus asaccharovorans]|uniref:alpha/beta fold hydrolase n=1 Tax=Chelatococcus asaccharovorans TaxID=28210 RepID=UPI00224C7500|nr:alpha/beta hydrolase [Chelatococcus asaccharovorans]CAH1669369.1 Pimeloyl-ACP methyl ester carboxylesterase [Chelatococcus asaccharovorans]CAH1679205.1 Pimeloyl-ACP methyl ester carboxylesterase [Chelatococcus asaccharovorans]
MFDAAPPHIPSRCETLEIRGLRYSVRRWGRENARPILMVHGTRDSSITFQFVVDHLEGDWQVIAPDWRGHGHSDRAQSYWLHDFVGDLAALFELLFPSRAVPLVGHSLGGNVAGIFAGLRPERISHLVSLDGFGPLVDHVPVDPVALLRRHIEAREREGRAYPDIATMAARLRQANPRLTQGQAMLLAEHSSAEGPDGQRRWLYTGDFQRSLPSLRTIAEWGRLWAGITAPALWVMSEDTRPNAPVRFPAEIERRAALMPRLARRQIPGTSHNLHHDEPAVVAKLIEDFISRPP